MSLVFIYIVVIQVLRDCAYLAKPDADLVIRSTLQAPDNLTASEDLPYCRPWGEDAMHHGANTVDIVTSRSQYEIVHDGSLVARTELERIFAVDIENCTIMLEPTIVNKPRKPSEPTARKFVAGCAVCGFKQ
eukprot:TRINITY_DN67854_c0_g1_i1.p2 TRINITY_DN67854_c0_g1~~TRINITY_DN67854_c0_g1_i1.p2  ORF type:complete len:132 (+),score=15.92 TRINITY_DN67854_c0_g1_i1:24-419(+)